MNFGDKLRVLIEEQGITQKELASHLNIAPSTVSSYVQNTREPDFATLKSFAKYFNVSIDYLLDCRTRHANTHQEDELLRIFRCLTDKQKEVCIEQCKVFIRLNNKQKETRKSSLLTSKITDLHKINLRFLSKPYIFMYKKQAVIIAHTNSRNRRQNCYARLFI